MATPTELQEAQRNNHVAAIAPDPTRVRVEIDEFLDDNAMTNLFLLALAEMQKEDPTKRKANGNEDWWTFYSLSGILVLSLLLASWLIPLRHPWPARRVVE